MSSHCSFRRSGLQHRDGQVGQSQRHRQRLEEHRGQLQAGHVQADLRR